MALEALEAAYHARGFNVVQVALPEQELDQGVVRLQVVETRIGKLRVEGNTVFSEDNIRRSLPGLVEGQTPNLGAVSSSLKLANENPSKKTTLQLQSGNEAGCLSITDLHRIAAPTIGIGGDDAPLPGNIHVAGIAGAGPV
jgi:hemolysin activation/secretion protein